ncbi:MAG: ferrous iron transport protein B [Anaerolineae bacterium]|nr:ferrous iron transport protein B [Thermoflexales bacterium]MDW8407812.1 ferrous iron transport protein B [Anaerolineae bacterium]
MPAESIALVGHPNVGKSVLFQRLTGRYANVSNYPGTTVEITRGAASFLPGVMVIDTPGVSALPAASEDEQVTARVLLHEPLRAILQVGDAKNLRRTLLLTIQLAEMGRPMALALNMMDEAEARGLRIDHQALSARMGVPVLPTVATRGAGIKELTHSLIHVTPPHFEMRYPEPIEQALQELCSVLPSSPIASRALGLLYLSRDPVAQTWIEQRADVATQSRLNQKREELQHALQQPIGAVIQQARLAWADQTVNSVITSRAKTDARSAIGAQLGRLAAHPLWGLPILALVLYGMYWFVGVFGAGDLVGLLEENLFGEVINPWVTDLVHRTLGQSLISEFLVGEYGVWTMGMTYALALILPIVTTFFIAFGILEDSGYLPRLAALTNRLFAVIGLNGKAVLPMVLGLGCVTMATMTTRILESKRDRLLVTLLLALAVPCSAQLGVVMGMLASVSFGATLWWAGVVSLVLLAVGWLAARLLPGERSILFVELPPLRLPQASNVAIKTLARLEWYIKEVVPLFLIGTAILFALDKIGVLPWLIETGQPVVSGWLGLPPEASAAFLMGFLRRDFGATGLFALESAGLLSPMQIVVGMVTITLFVPCVASVMMIARERGVRTALGILVLIFPLAVLVGGALYRLLSLLGWS